MIDIGTGGRSLTPIDLRMIIAPLKYINFFVDFIRVRPILTRAMLAIIYKANILM